MLTILLLLFNTISYVYPKHIPHPDMEDLKHVYPEMRDLTFWNDFQDMHAHHHFLNNLVRDSRGLAKLEVIGKSFEGMPLRVLKICGERCGDKPVIWVDGGIHGREWTSPAAVTFLAKNLIHNPRYWELRYEFDWLIMPVLNPDGYLWSHKVNRQWRKNRRRDKSNAKCKDKVGDANGPGVDLNRNWNWLPHEEHERGVCDSGYPGPHGFSEPETKAVRDYLMKFKGKIAIYNSVHTAGQKFVIPWGHTDEKWEHDWAVRAVLRAGIDAMGPVGKQWKMGNVREMYGMLVVGGSVNWAAAKLKAKFPFVTELVDKEKYKRDVPKELLLNEVTTFVKFMKAAAEQALRLIADETMPSDPFPGK